MILFPTFKLLPHIVHSKINILNFCKVINRSLNLFLISQSSILKRIDFKRYSKNMNSDIINCSQKIDIENKNINNTDVSIDFSNLEVEKEFSNKLEESVVTSNAIKDLLCNQDGNDELNIGIKSDMFHSVFTQSRGSNEESIVVLKITFSEGEDEQEEDYNELQSTEVPSDMVGDKEALVSGCEKRKASEDGESNKDLKKAKLETKALKAKRPGFTDDRYNETSYYIENGLRKVYPYYFTFTTFTKGRWVGEKILDVFAREFRAHPAEEYERCIRTGSLTVNYEKVDIDYRLKHNDLLANVVHRHEVPVTSDPITVVHMDEDVVVVNKPASIPVHPCGRYRHNTVVFILAKEYHLKNLRTIHRLDRLTSGLLLFGRTPKKARQMEHQIRNRQVQKEYVCRVEGEFPDEIECSEPIEVVSYKIGVCKVSPKGKECSTTFHKLGYNAKTNTSVVLCLPHTGRMHQIRVHLQYLGYPVVNDPLYNHTVFGPEKGKNGNIGKTDEELIRDLISIHNAENWLGMDGDSDLSMFKPILNYEEDEKGLSREPSPCENNMMVPPPPPLPSKLLQCANKVTVATQTGHEAPDLAFHPDKLTTDPHCYECKVKYRDPKPRDLVMYLHAWKYRGPGWSYQTELPEWAKVDWVEPDD
uniref:Pseudouridylate synthase RPUSD2 n=2 Tax=Clastoptera arizonana TaxID=38151 RepID=A0A1B6C5M5_9HEMI